MGVRGRPQRAGWAAAAAAGVAWGRLGSHAHREREHTRWLQGPRLSLNLLSILPGWMERERRLKT